MINAVTDRDMRTRATALEERIRAEDGAGRTAQLEAVGRLSTVPFNQFAEIRLKEVTIQKHIAIT